MDRNTITKAEAAKRLKVSVRTIERGVHLGILRASFNGLRGNRICGIYAQSVEDLRQQWVNAENGGYQTREITPKAKGGAR